MSHRSPLGLVYPVRDRRSGRVAEGGALLRRYGGTNLHRGFESLLLRLAFPAGRPTACRAGLRAALAPWPGSGREPVRSSTVLSAYADPGTRQKARYPSLRRRGGRAVECGGLKNRFGPLGPTRVQIPPPPPNKPEAGLSNRVWGILAGAPGSGALCPAGV